MKNIRFPILFLCLLFSFFVYGDYQPFQIKLKPSSQLPRVAVSSGNNPLVYNKAVLEFNQWTLEVRGQLTTNEFLSGYRIEQAIIRYGDNNNQTDYTIGVSGDKQSLTRNHGHQWAEHSININSLSNQQSFIDICNNAVSTDIENGLSQTQALNKNRVITIPVNQSSFTAGLWINVSDSPSYLTEEATTGLPITVSCQPTGYKKPLPTATNDLEVSENIQETNLTIQEQYSQYSGSCKVILSGMIKTNLPNMTVQYRYEHTNGNLSEIKSLTTSQARVGWFSHTYDVDNNPYDDEAGSIRFIGESHNFQSDWKTYSMRCEDAATTSLNTEIPPQLSLEVKVRETELIRGQICPKDVLLIARLTAGSSIDGNAIFIGSGTEAYQSDPIAFDLSIGQTKKFLGIRPVYLPSTLGHLQVTNEGEAELRKISLTQGITLMDANSNLIATTGQQNYTFHCRWPQVNPNVVGSQELQVEPDQLENTTGRLSLSPFQRRSNSAASQNDSTGSSKQVDQQVIKNGGSEAKRPLLILRNRGIIRGSQQEGRMLTDADQNPVESNHHSVVLENATIADAKAKHSIGKMDQRTTLYQGKAGDSCQGKKFPKTAVIRHQGKQQVVECINGKVTMNTAKKTTIEWKTGDPVLKPKAKKIKQEFRQGGFGDEMPDDLPAG